MLIDLDAAIMRSSKGLRWDEMQERCYVRPVQPGCKLVHPIAAALRGDNTIQARSILGLLCYLSVSDYIASSSHERLEKRVAVAAGAAECHIQRGQTISVIIGEQVVLSNHDVPKCDVSYDCTNERTLLVSLVGSGDLNLWERSDSRVLRGSKVAPRVMYPSCEQCAFARSNGRDSWCHATLLQQNAGQHCTDFVIQTNRAASARYVSVRADQIWIPKWVEQPQGDFVIPEAK